MKCEICGEPLTETAKFCSHCGNAVVAAGEVFIEKRGDFRVKTGLIICPDCGGAVSDDALQCPSCGKIIGRPALQRAREEAKRRTERAREEKERRAEEGKAAAIEETWRRGRERFKQIWPLSVALVLYAVVGLYLTFTTKADSFGGWIQGFCFFPAIYFGVGLVVFSLLALLLKALIPEKDIPRDGAGHQGSTPRKDRRL